MDIQFKNDSIGSEGARVKLEWNPRFIHKVNMALGSGGQLQQFIDTSILDGIHPYLPFDTGTLATSGKTNSIIGSGLLVWRTPYARYLYEGFLMVDPVYKVAAFHSDDDSGRFWSRRGIKKILAEPKVPLQFQGGARRGSRWPERWMRDNLTVFEKNLQRKAGELIRL